MARVLLRKCREAMTSVLPVTVIVVVLYLTPLCTLTGQELLVFLISSLFLIVGIGLFNLGADLAMTPMGEQIGSGLSRTKNLTLLLTVGFGMGMLITVAEPDLSVLAAQVSDLIEPVLLIGIVGAGVGLFLLLAVLKMIFRKNLAAMLLFFYLLLFALSALLLQDGKTDFLAVGFDSGGVTTGPITVPFIMALGVGIAAAFGGRDSAENSFGMVALCSVGPMLAVIALGVFSKGSVAYSLPDYSLGSHIGENLLPTILSVMKEVATALGLIVVFFILLQITVLKLPLRRLKQIAVGILYTFVGLVMFLSAVTVGYMPVGYSLGLSLGKNHPAVIVAFGMLIGFVVVLAEPAVHVLNRQVEDVTQGSVSQRSMMLALSIGVGISIALSMLRIVLDFNVLYYLVPGYILSLGLSFFVPPIYTAIAFDSGGVASGPLTSSFILPFSVGVCCVLQGEAKVMADAFGIVSMVAMTPLITIQLLGFRSIVARRVSAHRTLRRILDADDEQIIDFT